MRHRRERRTRHSRLRPALGILRPVVTRHEHRRHGCGRRGGCATEVRRHTIGDRRHTYMLGCLHAEFDDAHDVWMVVGGVLRQPDHVLRVPGPKSEAVVDDHAQERRHAVWGEWCLAPVGGVIGISGALGCFVADHDTAEGVGPKITDVGQHVVCTERPADEDRLVEIKCAQQCIQVGCALAEVVAGRGFVRATVPARVVGDDLEVIREAGELVGEEVCRAGPAGDEHEWAALAAREDAKRDPRGKRNHALCRVRGHRDHDIGHSRTLARCRRARQRFGATKARKGAPGLGGRTSPRGPRLISRP